jgi:hypothetical protein
MLSDKFIFYIISQFLKTALMIIDAFLKENIKGIHTKALHRLENKGLRN